MDLNEAVDASLEDLSDGESTVADHAKLLARDYGLTFEEAVAKIKAAYVADSWFDDHPLDPKQWEGVQL